jgi:hypothetical protein
MTTTWTESTMSRLKNDTASEYRLFRHTSERETMLLRLVSIVTGSVPVRSFQLPIPTLRNINPIARSTMMAALFSANSAVTTSVADGSPPPLRHDDVGHHCSFSVVQFPCRSDNYGYLLHDEISGQTAAVDTPDGAAYQRELSKRGWCVLRTVRAKSVSSLSLVL